MIEIKVWIQCGEILIYIIKALNFYATTSSVNEFDKFKSKIESTIVRGLL